jgi:hypothetical protein
MPDLTLKVVDGLALPEQHRVALRPGELVPDADGRLRRLPRWFYEVPTRRRAEETELAPGFVLREFLTLDLHEAAPLRAYPRYVPCAVALLAAHLAVLRQDVGTRVYIAANGGYRSPGHARSRPGSTHAWATAANVYRIGDDYLETEESLSAAAETVRRVLPAVWVRPYGHGHGFADDHLHLDLGFTTVVPPEAAGEDPDHEPTAADGGE